MYHCNFLFQNEKEERYIMKDMFEEFILKINVMFVLMHFKEMKVRTMNTFERFPL